MATNFDRAVGWGMIALAAIIFTYYSIWVIVLPFIPRREKIHTFFLPRYYATAIPLGLMVAALIVICITVAIIMMKQKLKSKPKKE